MTNRDTIEHILKIAKVEQIRLYLRLIIKLVIKTEQYKLWLSKV